MLKKGKNWYGFDIAVKRYFDKYYPKTPEQELRELWGLLYEDVPRSVGDNESLWNKCFSRIRPLLDLKARQVLQDAIDKCGYIETYDGNRIERYLKEILGGYNQKLRKQYESKGGE